MMSGAARHRPKIGRKGQSEAPSPDTIKLTFGTFAVVIVLCIVAVLFHLSSSRVDTEPDIKECLTRIQQGGTCHQLSAHQLKRMVLLLIREAENRKDTALISEAYKAVARLETMSDKLRGEKPYGDAHAMPSDVPAVAGSTPVVSDVGSVPTTTTPAATTSAPVATTPVVAPTPVPATVPPAGSGVLVVIRSMTTGRFARVEGKGPVALSSRPELDDEQNHYMMSASKDEEVSFSAVSETGLLCAADNGELQISPTGTPTSPECTFTISEMLLTNKAKGVVGLDDPRFVTGKDEKDCTTRIMVHLVDFTKAVPSGVPTYVKPQKTASNELVIATSANEPFFDRLKNFVASVQHWEPNLKIVVTDLGLNDSQRNQIKSWRQVEDLIPFDFSKYDPHVKDLHTYAWKPIVMKDMLDIYPKIFYSDPSVEFRQPIDEIRHLIDTYGHFYVHQEGIHTNLHCCGPVNELTFQGTMDYLGVNKGMYEGKFMCAGGIQGYAKGSDAYNKVLLPTVECAKVKDCIAPNGAGIPNHRFDQSVFSVHINKEGFKCQCHSRFFAYDQTARPTGDILNDRNDVVLFMARGQKGNQYARHIKNK